MTKEVVKADKTFRTLERSDDVVGLLRILQDLCYGTDKKRYVQWVQQAQLRRAVTLAQRPTETLQQFATNFLEQIKTLEDICGPLVPVRDLIKRVQQTRIVGEGDKAVEETHTVPVLADEEVVIYKARNESMSSQILSSKRQWQQPLKPTDWLVEDPQLIETMSERQEQQL